MQKASAHFQSLFPERSFKTVYSPYRVCPLGAHVDHQQGYVTGMTLDHGVTFVYSPEKNGTFRITSLDFPSEVRFGLSSIPAYVPGHWGNYLYGSAKILKERYGIRQGLSGVIHGSLPIGGLSSSAAVLSAYLLALADVNGLEISRKEFVSLARWVENKFIGLNNGILDQASNLLSRNGSLLYMDTQTEEYQLIPKAEKMPPFSIGVFYSGISKALIATDYNNRVNECREAAKMLYLMERGVNPEGCIVLRDIPDETFQRFGSQLPLRLYKRAKHFFEENQRVHQGIELWKQGDLKGFGKLMFASGNSSIQLYESGCPELIDLFDILKETQGIYGARFSGAGYRGCCIAFVDPLYQESITASVRERYLQKHPQFQDVFQIDFCQTDNGVRIL